MKRKRKNRSAFKITWWKKVMDACAAPWSYSTVPSGMDKMMPEHDFTFKECEWAVVQPSNSIPSLVLSPVEKCC